MRWLTRSAQRGVAAALAAAALFGISTPAAKLLLSDVSPWMLAGLLYLGSGLGLAIVRLFRTPSGMHLDRTQAAWLAAAVLSGGVVAPVLLLWGLSGTAAASASLLLNGEGVFTALLAWFVFRENFDRRIALGMTAILAGALVLAWSPGAGLQGGWPALAVLGACLGWALDNNFTRNVANADATFVAMVKGLAAGSANLALAFGMGGALPAPATLGAAMGVGFVSYGLSLTLFVLSLRRLGTARSGAYFSTAPFIGAIVSVLVLGETASARLLIAASLMAVGVWLHLSERHEHEHTHLAVGHEHAHEHDEHHSHDHPNPVEPGTVHSHLHTHEPLAHTHPHYPDEQHRHGHGPKKSSR